MDLQIAGKVALVTGASKGIGRAIAADLAAEGCRVAISSRSRSRIDLAAEAIGAEGFVLDSQDLDAARRLVGEVEARCGGPVDILVCNTGGPPAGPDPLGFGHEDWVAAHRELVLAPMALIEAVLPAMRERGWGRVLNVVSTAAREPSPVLMLSNTHRAAMLAAFRTLARSAAPDGVTFNSVLPGRIDTDRLIEMLGSLEAAQAQARQEVPAGRLGTVQEIAAAATFLLSGPASYVTGQTLAVDGGLLRAV